jgi:hypothetical protein
MTDKFVKTTKSIKYEDTTQKRHAEPKGLKPERSSNNLQELTRISKFESGNRRPTKEQVVKLAILLEIDFESIMASG